MAPPRLPVNFSGTQAASEALIAFRYVARTSAGVPAVANVTRGVPMISPDRLKLKRTDICMPSRAEEASGGDQQDRSAANRSPMLSRSWSGFLVFGGLGLRRRACDRQLQVLAIGIVDLGNAGAVIEHAAERRRTGLPVQHAARRMRKRRGIELTPLLGIGSSGTGDRRHGHDERENDAPAHETDPPRQGNTIDSASPRTVIIRQRIAGLEIDFQNMLGSRGAISCANSTNPTRRANHFRLSEVRVKPLR